MKQAKRNSTSGKSWLRRHRVWILLAPAWITSTALLIRVALHYGNWNLFEPLMVTALLGLPIGVLCALKLTRVSGSESSNGWHAVGRFLLWLVVLTLLASLGFFMVEELPLRISGP